MMQRFHQIRPWAAGQWRDVGSGLRSGDPMQFGLAASKVFGLFIIVLGIFPNMVDGGWELRVWTFLKAPPNEIGDTLAGIAGALAFLWIIVTVQLQSRELEEQRKELKRARQEYAAMAAAQGEQVKLMEAQAKIFADEQRQRDEARASAMLRQLLERVVLTLKGLEIYAASKERESHLTIGAFPRCSSKIEIPTGIGCDDRSILKVAEQVHRFNDGVGKIVDYHTLAARLLKREVFEVALQEICGVLDVSGLSDADKERIKDMKLSELRDNIQELLGRDVWDADEELVGK